MPLISMPISGTLESKDVMCRCWVWTILLVYRIWSVSIRSSTGHPWKQSLNRNTKLWLRQVRKLVLRFCWYSWDGLLLVSKQLNDKSGIWNVHHSDWGEHRSSSDREKETLLSKNNVASVVDASNISRPRFRQGSHLTALRQIRLPLIPHRVGHKRPTTKHALSYSAWGTHMNLNFSIRFKPDIRGSSSATFITQSNDSDHSTKLVRFAAHASQRNGNPISIPLVPALTQKFHQRLERFSKLRRNACIDFEIINSGPWKLQAASWSDRLD